MALWDIKWLHCDYRDWGGTEEDIHEDIVTMLEEEWGCYDIDAEADIDVATGDFSVNIRCKNDTIDPYEVSAQGIKEMLAEALNNRGIRSDLFDTEITIED